LPVVIPSSIPQGIPATPSLVPVNINTAIAVLTDTPNPTFTAVVKTVPPPTNTAFVPPADGILFQDNFENGLSQDWHIYTGKWIVANGKLTKLQGEPYSNLYDWIGLEKPEWKNYIFSLTINEPNPATEEVPIALAVRTNTTELQYIGIELDFWPWIYLSLISDDNTKSFPIAGQNKDFSFPIGTDVPVEIEVRDNTYTLRVIGRDVQTVTMPGYDSGGIKLGLDCTGFTGCPSFDNVKLTYLP
jgi:hypothetical protein